MKKLDSRTVIAAAILSAGATAALFWTMDSGSAQNKNDSAPHPATIDVAQRLAESGSRTSTGREGRGESTTFFDRTLPASRDLPEVSEEPVGRRVVIEGRTVPGAASPSEIELVLAPGVREPVVMIESREEFTPAQQGALDTVLENFVSRVETAASSASPQDLARVWEEEKAQADSAYRILFGDSALQQQISTAAGRARSIDKSGQ